MINFNVSCLTPNPKAMSEFQDWKASLLADVKATAVKLRDVQDSDHSRLIARELMRRGITETSSVEKAMREMAHLHRRENTLELTIIMDELQPQWKMYRVTLQEHAAEYFRDNAHQTQYFKHEFFNRVTFLHLWNPVWMKYVGPPARELGLLDDIANWLMRTGEESAIDRAAAQRSIVPARGTEVFPMSSQELSVAYQLAEFTIRKQINTQQGVTRDFKQTFQLRSKEINDTRELSLKIERTLTEIEAASHIRISITDSILASEETWFNTERVVSGLVDILGSVGMAEGLPPLEERMRAGVDPGKTTIKELCASDAFKQCVFNFLQASVIAHQFDAIANLHKLMTTQGTPIGSRQVNDANSILVKRNQRALDSELKKLQNDMITQAKLLDQRFLVLQIIQRCKTYATINASKSVEDLRTGMIALVRDTGKIKSDLQIVKAKLESGWSLLHAGHRDAVMKYTQRTDKIYTGDNETFNRIIQNAIQAYKGSNAEISKDISQMERNRMQSGPEAIDQAKWQLFDPRLTFDANPLMRKVIPRGNTDPLCDQLKARGDIQAQAAELKAAAIISDSNPWSELMIKKSSYTLSSLFRLEAFMEWIHFASMILQYSKTNHSKGDQEEAVKMEGLVE